MLSINIGRQKDDLLPSPEKPNREDFLILENTYKDRFHLDEGGETLLRKKIEIINLNGTLIIPSFAVEQLQSLLYKLWKRVKIPGTPILLIPPRETKSFKFSNGFRAGTNWNLLNFNK